MLCWICPRMLPFLLNLAAMAWHQMNSWYLLQPASIIADFLDTQYSVASLPNGKNKTDPDLSYPFA